MAEKYNTVLIGSWDRSVISWNEKEDKGVEKYWGDHWGFPMVLNGLIEKYSNNGIGLEVGCGSARLLTRFHKYFKKLYGVDTSTSAIKQSIGRIKELKIKNIDVSVSDGFTLDKFDDNSLDLVYSQDVFQHFNTSLIYVYLKEFSRVLKTGGIAIVNFRNIFTDFDRFRSISNQYAKERPHNFSIWVRYVTPELIKKISDDVSLNIIERKQQYEKGNGPELFVFKKL